MLLGVLSSWKLSPPNFIRVLYINLEMRLEAIEEKSGHLLDVVCSGKMRNIDPHIFAQDVGEMDSLLPSNSILSISPFALKSSC